MKLIEFQVQPSAQHF